MADSDHQKTGDDAQTDWGDRLDGVYPENGFAVGKCKIARLDPAQVLEGFIEEVQEGVRELNDRRTALSAEADRIVAEADSIDATLLEAEQKLDMLRDARLLVKEADELAGDLPKPAAPYIWGGGNGAEPAAAPTPLEDAEIEVGPVDPSPDPPQAPESEDAPAPEPDPPADDDEEEPPAEGTAPPAGEAAERLMEAARSLPGWRSKDELFAEAGYPTGRDAAPSARRALQVLVKAGRIHAKGATKARRYRLAAKTTPATPPAAHKARPSSEDDREAKGHQEPTLEGRVFAACQLAKLDLGQIASRVGATVPKVKEAVDKLVAEGDLRPEGGHPVLYSAVL